MFISGFESNFNLKHMVLCEVSHVILLYFYGKQQGGNYQNPIFTSPPIYSKGQTIDPRQAFFTFYISFITCVCIHFCVVY